IVLVRQPGTTDARNAETRTTAEVKQSGFSAPIPLLTPAECAGLAEHLSQPRLPAPLDWWKGRAASDRIIYEIAADPRLIALLRPLLGDDIVLWGANVVLRRRGATHPWHTDMESAAPDCRAATVWLAIRHASERSG